MKQHCELPRRIGTHLQDFALPDQMKAREALELFTSAAGCGQDNWRDTAKPPVHLASYRQRGVRRRYLASPIPVVALLVVALAVSLAGTAILLAVGMTAYDVHAPRPLPGRAQLPRRRPRL